ncbi:MAG TPA: hypothetical protein PK152_00205 [Anaerolineales bacterium]|nr:hypothetical protein [Anaerolineales bacterium]HRK87521.1 hypothetical protein [Anaerolineales bacterium]
MNNQLNLSRILLANGVFCSTSGLIFTLAANPLAGFLNTLPLVMTILGIGLLLYGMFIMYMSMRSAITRDFTLFTVLADSTWVVFSVLLLILPMFNFAADAKWAIGVVAVVVDVFATLQFMEWRKM